MKTRSSTSTIVCIFCRHDEITISHFYEIEHVILRRSLWESYFGRCFKQWERKQLRTYRMFRHVSLWQKIPDNMSDFGEYWKEKIAR